MDILEENINCEEKFPCEDESCCDLLCNQVSHNPNFIQNPIFQHSLELRRYLVKSNRLLEEYRKPVAELNYSDRKNTDNFAKGIESLKPLLDIPPFQETWKHSKSITRMKCRKELDRNIVEEQQKYFIISVCIHSGYTEFDEEVITELVKANDRFLKKLTSILCRTGDTMYTNDTLVHLDYSLLRIRFGGIKGLHNFYQEQIIKKHNLLLEACEKRRKSIINET